MTNLSLVNCRISERNKAHPMIEAVVIDHDHKVRFNIIEWIDPDTHHIDREHSYTVDHYDHNMRFVALNEIFDAIDRKLDTIWVEQHEKPVGESFFAWLAKFLRINGSVQGASHE